MRSNYKKLGPFISPQGPSNKDMEVKELLGICNQKYFQKSQTNTVGIDLSTYRIVRTDQFAFNRATTRNGEKISIALRQGEDCIVSPSYRIFKVKDENELLSEYLLMWFKRPEFDRYVRVKSHGSAHEFFEYDQMCEVELPIPSPIKQREIVKEYNLIKNRIALNNQLIQKLEETAQAIYKQWFVDFEFSNENGLPYKSNGGEMITSEFGEIPKAWEIGKLNDIMTYSNNRISVNKLSINNYISTENMIQDKGGIVPATNLPSVPSVTKFSINEILLSNIRLYLKKIRVATFDGGCSNDVLCIVPRKGISTRFLYYSLDNDNFFDYAISGSKGTKMPRGDKKWIMNYSIIIPDNQTLNSFARITKIISQAIGLKSQENIPLEALKSLLLSKLATIEK